MDVDSALLLAFGFVYVGAVVYLANQADIRGEFSIGMRLLLYGLTGIMGMVGLTMLQITLFGGDVAALSNVNTTAAFATFVFSLAAVVFSFLLLSGNPRALHIIQRISGPKALYKPTSAVHNTAVVLMLVLLVVTIGTFVIGGGLSGFAQDIQSVGISPVEPVLVAVLQVAVAFLGIGLGLRRTMGESLHRLGLNAPTFVDISRGIGGGILLYGVTLAFAAVWAALVPAEQITQQTQASEQLARAFDTLPMAFIVSTSAALGEEIFIRGALQPVFGLFATSLFFTFLHTQYLITPGLLLILMIALGLGWIRQQYNTTTAIMAHFVYNFIQLALLALQVSQGGG